ncbi:larval cuticle protein A2B-like [Eupeodes corollae]|uniref:larval cuticle protein A2B-like n=1 Tax=Eupeodes corollae TaxID=290404 RepID=UPI00248FA8EB|nr:larval cuticle protein A2B-like [Eupeodes corollae]
MIFLYHHHSNFVYLTKHTIQSTLQMAFKFVFALALIAAASAGLLPAGQVYHAAPALAVSHPVLTKDAEQYDPHPQYKFSYDINDSLTGDVKSQVEARDGDIVQGEYSLNDADGFKRTVQYSSDPVHGFNAVVNREPLGASVKAVAAPSPVVAYAAPAPALIKSSPITYAAAPVLSYHH